MDAVKFYYEYKEHGYLSNYFVIDISVDGEVYRSVEHYYQSQKTLDPEMADRIKNAPTCDDAKTLGNSPGLVLREDWGTYKVDVMRKALEAKFTQHVAMKRQLLDTGDAVLMEDSQKDYFWGIGADGTGKSMLGKLLMELRSELRTAAVPKT
ncbi:NADAR family protein [Breznakiella homolactica]|uniref:NADAR family protein n=1 Tax=Breznakiella homolactica TaxID=2798577 RepID=A0A7T7XL37_9SPIR|nr:NADAR family protein [Breznakiella homolactica]QQO08379.1 NADAR family protein [Breznakiella homolactica]